MKPLKFLIVIVVIMAASLIFTSCNNGSNNVNPAKSTATTQDHQLAGDSMYTCTMHDSVMSDHSGKCPTCGMTLIKQKMTAKQAKMMKDNTYIKPQE